jgi:hypothetical protein
MKAQRETMNKIIIDGKKIYLSKYHKVENALSSLSQYQKPARVVMGDYDDPWGGFWVCRPSDAARLERAGYEIIG